MVFVNGILNGTRTTVQWYLNGTWLNGILNGPMIFWMVLIRSSSASSSMVFWMVYHRTVFLVPFKYHSNTIQLFIYTDHRSTIEVPFKYHWPLYPLGPFKYHSNTIQIPFKYHSNTIQIPFKCLYTQTTKVPLKYHSNTIGHYTPRTIQIPFKYHSIVYIHRPPNYHWSTIQIPLAIIPPSTIQWYLNGTFL